MTSDESRAAARRLHMKIEPKLSDKDLDLVASFLKSLDEEAYERGKSVRPVPFKMREVMGLPTGRVWEMG